MRKTFFEELTKMAKKDDRIYLLVADVGYGCFEEFQEKFPRRFINVGVAEQNMVNIAVGLALCGKIPFIYTMATFITMRPFEQIRNYIGDWKLKVRIIGVGGHNDYPVLDISHNVPKDEDVKLMTLVPNLFTYVPDTKEELRHSMKSLFKFNNPIYVRLSR